MPYVLSDINTELHRAAVSHDDVGYLAQPVHPPRDIDMLMGISLRLLSIKPARLCSLLWSRI
jgi:hypothetical protein